MKNLLFVFAVLVVALPVAAYQAGQQNRTNFGAGQQAAAGQQQQFRSFSNYNNRSWGQGVQTQGVQTQVAGSSVTDFGKNAAQKTVGKKQAVAPKPAAGQKPATQPAAGQATNADPAAMMQQVQGMMSAMGNMAGTAQPGAAGQAGQMPAMPAGMPDMSALMGGAMPAVNPTANPAGAPAKK